MRAMILAAGRGERMGALTENTPKPLLRVANRYLIEYAINQLVRANIREIVINVSYHGAQIKTVLGNGERFGASFAYSEEAKRLETGGGIFNALPLLGEQPFIVLSSDIITDYPLKLLPTDPDGLAHLVLVNNPVFHPRGDFGLRGEFIDKQIAGPIQTPNGFHIIRLGEVRSSGPEQTAPTRKDIENLLLQRKFEEAVQNWVSKLRSQAYIAIKNPDKQNSNEAA